MIALGHAFLLNSKDNERNGENGDATDESLEALLVTPQSWSSSGSLTLVSAGPLGCCSLDI